MRALLIGTLAATLVGCSRLLPPQVGMEACTDAHPFACFTKPASSKTSSKPRSTMAAKTEKPSSAHVRDRAHLATKKAKSTVAAKVEAPTYNQPAETSDPVMIK